VYVCICMCIGIVERKSLHHLSNYLFIAFTVPAFPYVIRDYPKYSWRGLMVDLARHFIPLPLIKRTVDGMALSKLNVLHLHLTDAQSFPVQLEDKPGLNLSQLAKLLVMLKLILIPPGMLNSLVTARGVML
jgi:hypothetical protein